MQTQSHLLLTAAALTPLRHRVTINPMIALAILAGAVLPDVPFFILTVAGEVYYRWLATPPPDGSIMEYLHFTLFYHNPLWIVAHNFFHSLAINSVLLLVGLWFWRWHNRRWGMVIFWLAVSMFAHVTLDIFTHHTDGPLIWFPVSWTYRFASPVSYWEADYGGQTFLVFEIFLNLILIGYLLAAYCPWMRRRWPRG